jgi:diguanylate cyclase (GGDEF)-like protein/PAS domain S-box-containing protein
MVDVSTEAFAWRDAGPWNESRYRAVFECVSVPLALLDGNGRAVAANGALIALLGLTADQLGSVLAPPPGSIPSGRLRFDRDLSRVGGSILPCRITLTPISEAGATHVAEVEDRTARQRHQQALEAAEARYRDMFEHALEGIFQTSADGHYLAANGALARLYGYQSVADLISGLTNIGAQLYVEPGRRDEFIRLMQAQGEVRDFVSEVRRKDGSTIWISEICRAVRDPGGKLLYFEGMVEDVTARRQVEQNLRHIALHDSLTGLPNRSLFFDRLGHAIHRYQRAGALYAVLFIDCDRFKQINDTFGHAAGDKVLMELARRVGAGLRASDTLARLGGDEFAILAEDLEQPEDVEVVAARARATMVAPILLEGRPYRVTISIGVVYGMPRYTAACDLLKDADVALYQAKAAGRDCHVVFHSA